MTATLQEGLTTLQAHAGVVAGGSAAIIKDIN